LKVYERLHACVYQRMDKVRLAFLHINLPNDTYRHTPCQPPCAHGSSINRRFSGAPCLTRKQAVPTSTPQKSWAWLDASADFHNFVSVYVARRRLTLAVPNVTGGDAGRGKREENVREGEMECGVDHVALPSPRKSSQAQGSWPRQTASPFHPQQTQAALFGLTAFTLQAASLSVCGLKDW
ncbi:unnamed protein product, partial [Pleuronectes platessa]